MTEQTRDLMATLERVLLRCWAFAFGLLMIWLVAMLTLAGVIDRIHGPMFGLTAHELDVIFYCALGALKILTLVFLFIPWLSIKLVLRRVG
ncbi:MAG: hypothetical protein KDB14_03770 [Planctomycetales bacterium]|nr:hypothetical protein [Planctomycetales bacterium]